MYVFFVRISHNYSNFTVTYLYFLTNLLNLLIYFYSYKFTVYFFLIYAGGEVDLVDADQAVKEGATPTQINYNIFR